MEEAKSKIDKAEEEVKVEDIKVAMDADDSKKTQ